MDTHETHEDSMTQDERAEYDAHIEDVSTNGRMALIGADGIIASVYVDAAELPSPADGEHVERVYWTPDGWTRREDADTLAETTRAEDAAEFGFSRGVAHLDKTADVAHADELDGLAKTDEDERAQAAREIAAAIETRTAARKLRQFADDAHERERIASHPAFATFTDATRERIADDGVRAMTAKREEDADLPYDAVTLGRKAARAFGAFVRGAHLRGLRAKLADTSYSVERGRSTEDGRMWQIVETVNDAVTPFRIVDDGWLNEEDAIRCALDYAALGSLTNDERAAVDEMRDYCGHNPNAYGIAAVDERGVIEYRYSDGATPDAMRADMLVAYHDERGVSIVDVSGVRVMPSTPDAEALADLSGVPSLTIDGLELTAAQRLTIAKLHEHMMRSWRAAVDVRVASYGTLGAAVLVLSTDTPCENPCVAIWQDGNAHLVYTDADFEAWQSVLGSRVIIERAEDAVYIIERGGSYSVHATRDKL